MKVLFQIGHPAHVHFFKNVIWELNRRDHKVIIISRKKDVTIELLDSYGFQYEIFEHFSTSLAGKAIDLIHSDFFVYRLARKKRPDVMIALGSPSIAHAGWLLGIPSIFFNDTEDAHIANNLAKPFATVMLTPQCFREDFGRKHVRFNGYKELASLHPKYFTPDPSVLDDLGINKGEPYIVVRRISYDAHHDIGLKGIKKENEFYRELEKYGRVLVSSENPSEKNKYSYKIVPAKFHSLLAYATLYIGEGGTTAAEAALLGTPAIHIEADSHGQATGYTCGNFLELRDRYQLLYFFPDEKQALIKAKEILDNNTSKAEWKRKRDVLISDKIDVTAWMTNFIERLPEQCKKITGSPS
jgi:uncharacterized protein